ncbi:class I SAM-dependent methyltransferase [Euryarchaeota archaeon]|nr:class I SAM-dependent methyltransferase [Euryarchaeota archaeon]
MTKNKRTHRHGIYKLYAPIYDRFMAPSFADGHSKMYQPLNLKSEDHILEVGVGTGISLTNIPDFVKVDAIDYSEPMLVKARKRQENGDYVAQITFQQMDAHVLEFDNNQFDHSVVAHTLAVVAEPEVVLKEIIRVTKPSGLIVIVNHYKDKKGIIGTLWNPFRKRLGLGKHVDFKQLIDTCGLELLSDERVNRFTTHSKMLVCKVP